MILESVVTTVDLEGHVNIAPMGPIVQPPTGEQRWPTFLLRPYEGSQTCRNLLATGKAVIHVTDDALLIARAAVGRIDSQGLVCPAENASEDHVRLIDCHRWFAIEINEYGGTPPRHELVANCVAEGLVRPFFGFNRAKHAVIEAAILATRIGLIDASEIREQMRHLATPVEKTAGPNEREAFELLRVFVNDRLAAEAESSK